MDETGTRTQPNDTQSQYYNAKCRSRSYRIDQTIKQLKLDVINQRIDKKEISLIRPEILDSWIRSFNYGLSCFDYNFAPPWVRKPCSSDARKASLWHHRALYSTVVYHVS